MKKKDSKQCPSHDKRSRLAPLMVIIFSGLSFYLGGIYYSELNRIIMKDEKSKVLTSEETTVASFHVKSVEFPECSINNQDYTPCTDPKVRSKCYSLTRLTDKKPKVLLKRWRKYGNYRLTFMERHCPPMIERKECLVPPPDGYKLPIRWPKSRDQCWYRNVPYDWINNEKADQHWLRKQGDKFFFPGGGTMFPNGVSAYVDLMQDLIPGMKDGTVRTAIDTGCGVASWGGDLLDRGILTISLAPRDNHEAQVQFALERGIPAILGIISTQRLPFPSNSFDVAHCSRCLIPWTEFDGIYLLEIHRILRPGGFWVLSGPPINYENRWRGWNTTVEAQNESYENLQKLLKSMCFNLYDKKDDIAVWQKSPNNTCYAQLTPSSYPPKCDDSMDPDSAWYTPLRACLTVPNQNYMMGLASTPKWPDRLKVPSQRTSMIPSGDSGGFKHDESIWKLRIEHYKTLLPALGGDKIRNVMDMNTLYGGFAAALINSPVWVMNVVSSYGPNSLAAVHDRGLIGTYHDWCEPFSTYPRTYDLLHLDGLFTAESHRCEMKYVLLEMDRILRPNGYVIMRESTYFLDAITSIAKGMRWDCNKHNIEQDSEAEKLLMCQKKLWYAMSSEQ